MEKIIHKYELEWNNILIEIRYTPNWSTIGYKISHLEVETKEPKRCPLPFTESGYRSHFFQAEEMEGYDSPITYVQEWLNEAAQSKEWIELQEKSKQMSFF